MSTNVDEQQFKREHIGNGGGVVAGGCFCNDKLKQISSCVLSRYKMNCFAENITERRRDFAINHSHQSQSISSVLV